MGNGASVGIAGQDTLVLKRLNVGKMKKGRGQKILLFCLLGLVVVMAMFRVALPAMIRSKVNQSLGNAGHVQGVGVSLWRGAYQLEGLIFPSKEKNEDAPIFYCREIDIGMEWRAIFNGSIVAAVTWIDPQVNFYTGIEEKKPEETPGGDWSDAVRGLVPVQINRLEVQNGEIHFRDPGTPPLDLYLNHLSLLADGLNVRRGDSEKFPGAVTASGKVMKSGLFGMSARIDSQAKDPALVVSAKIEELDLRDLNLYFNRYLGFEVSEGTLNVAGEASAAEGGFSGNVTPVISRLKFREQQGATSFSNYLKKKAAGILGWIFTRTKKSHDATGLSYHGKFKNPGLNLWLASVSLFKNAFETAVPFQGEGKASVQKLDPEFNGKIPAK